METIEFIIGDDGTITERTIVERDLDAGQRVFDAITEEVKRPIRNLLKIANWGMVHANVGLRDSIWSVPIRKIPLHARFRLVGGVLVPQFGSRTEIEFPLTWQAPDDVRLVFAVRTAFENDYNTVTGNWLFAFDKDNRGYRLPLPNLHDDCLICTGNFQDTHESASECVIASLEQFKKSKWNDDLMRTVEQSQKFFRFHPTNDSFETLPIESADWTTLCDKVSTALMERIVL
ncbi:MAG: hypothetical protein ACXWJX_02370 [Limisphaerales bacterium]